MTPLDAARWFLRDMAMASGYPVPPVAGADRLLSGYASYRPLLTAADPWYFAGIIALEACKVVDYYRPEYSDAVMRHVAAEADRIIGRDGSEVADLVFLLMGRLGIGTVLMRGKVPDSVLGKMMSILIGSPKAAEARMPAPEAHQMLRAALKLGKPVWWRVFRAKYSLSLDPAAEREEAKLKPIQEPVDRAAEAADRRERRKETVAATSFAGAMAELLANDGILVPAANLAEPAP